mmetsp:Transcript_4647/g.7589  ORF Transcript_4647/g.7589 Transcript_4647/m.7589 type:complete len:201 (-) Transcript_4647:813-1415(-)
MSKLSILTPSTTGSAGAAPAVVSAVVSAVAPAAVELVLVLVLVAETAGADTARSALLGMSATPGVEAAATASSSSAGGGGADTGSVHERGRPIRWMCASSTVSSPAKICSTAENIGMSSPQRRANSTATRAVGTPSTVDVLRISSTFSPLLNRMPIDLFLDKLPNAVSMRSPTPASPLIVSGSPPIALHSCCNSMDDLVK